jgi:hypothetical protein
MGKKKNKGSLNEFLMVGLQTSAGSSLSSHFRRLLHYHTLWLNVTP